MRTPDGARTFFNLHAVGTQNYTAAEDGSYISTGSSAELFEGTFKKGRHYVSASGIPVWEVHDNLGAVKGSVKGRALTKVARKPEASDGGFGSVDSVLYVTYDAEGWLADVTYIELQSPLGGVVPRGMHALPAHENVVDNHKLVIPYQAEYVLLTGGLPYGPIGEGGKERLESFERHLHHPMTKDSLRLRKAMSAHEHSRP